MTATAVRTSQVIYVSLLLNNVTGTESIYFQFYSGFGRMDEGVSTARDRKLHKLCDVYETTGCYRF